MLAKLYRGDKLVTSHYVSHADPVARTASLGTSFQFYKLQSVSEISNEAIYQYSYESQDKSMPDLSQQFNPQPRPAAQWWKTPPCSGRYRISISVKDWDITNDIDIVRVETYTKVFLRYQFPQAQEKDLMDGDFPGRLWFGPMPSVTQPSKEFLDSLKEPSAP